MAVTGLDLAVAVYSNGNKSLRRTFSNFPVIIRVVLSEICKPT